MYIPVYILDTCLCVYVHMYMCVCMYIQSYPKVIYVCMPVCICIYVHAYIYVHTHCLYMSIFVICMYMWEVHNTQSHPKMIYMYVLHAYVCMYVVYVCAYIQSLIKGDIYAYVYVCVYLCVSVLYTCRCMCIHEPICVCMHACAHTQSVSFSPGAMRK